METFRIKMKQNCCFIPKFVLKCLGLSLSEKRSRLYRIYSSFIIIMPMIYPFFTLHMILHSLDDFDSLMNGLFNMLGGIAGDLKIFIIMRNRKKLNEILKKTEQIQEKYNIEEWSQSEIYETNKKIFVSTVLFYVPMVYFYTSTLVQRFQVSDGRKWRIPIVDITVINTTYSPNYEIAWTYQVFASTMTSSTFCIPDFLVAGIIIDLTVQLKILKRNVQKTICNTLNNVNEKEPEISDVTAWMHFQKTLRDIVTYHLTILDLARDANEICSLLILIDVLGNLCMTCFTVYYASVLPLFDVKALQSYFEIIALILTLFIMCYCGTALSLASESIATACYKTDFVGANIKFQKGLMMIIMRSQKPITMTVGKFATLTIPVFVWIIRSSYSFFMVLRKSNQSYI